MLVRVSCTSELETASSLHSPTKSRYCGALSVRPSQMTCWLSPRNKYNLWLRAERLSIHPANPFGKHGVFSSDASVGGRMLLFVQADLNTAGMKQPWGDVHALQLMGVFKRSLCDEERPSHSLNNDQGNNAAYLEVLNGSFNPVISWPLPRGAVYFFDFTKYFSCVSDVASRGRRV